MAKFKPSIDEMRGTRAGWQVQLGNTKEIYVLRERCKQAAKDHNVSMTQIVLQMIEHCLTEMEY